ncbi:hypothetical protein DLAC_07460 [Tieghemostelium lacteum]|uniref:CCHC-type domain-containing protein n=1 Tax=Tieghemostelium lacteum TaxID=361077 RepID=A0A151ZCK6_TIELA|nr:hypothetical protein DLAC_07460 [Tieghemostelium lacteum]|eukprot:KYQ91683.1 hypothetical protein DLAC_07460 [Tieghemostelium lacteum]
MSENDDMDSLFDIFEKSNTHTETPKRKRDENGNESTNNKTIKLEKNSDVTNTNKHEYIDESDENLDENDTNDNSLEKQRIQELEDQVRDLEKKLKSKEIMFGSEYPLFALNQSFIEDTKVTELEDYLYRFFGYYQKVSSTSNRVQDDQLQPQNENTEITYYYKGGFTIKRSGKRELSKAPTSIPYTFQKIPNYSVDRESIVVDTEKKFENSTISSIVCFNCSEIGHPVQQCPIPYDHKRVQMNKATHSNRNSRYYQYIDNIIKAEKQMEQQQQQQQRHSYSNNRYSNYNSNYRYNSRSRSGSRERRRGNGDDYSRSRSRSDSRSRSRERYRERERERDDNVYYNARYRERDRYNDQYYDKSYNNDYDSHAPIDIDERRQQYRNRSTSPKSPVRTKDPMQLLEEQKTKQTIDIINGDNTNNGETVTVVVNDDVSTKKFITPTKNILMTKSSDSPSFEHTIDFIHFDNNAQYKSTSITTQPIQSITQQKSTTEEVMDMDLSEEEGQL